MPIRPIHSSSAIIACSIHSSPFSSFKATFFYFCLSCMYFLPFFRRARPQYLPSPSPIHFFTHSRVSPLSSSFSHPTLSLLFHSPPFSLFVLNPFQARSPLCTSLLNNRNWRSIPLRAFFVAHYVCICYWKGAGPEGEVSRKVTRGFGHSPNLIGGESKMSMVGEWVQSESETPLSPIFHSDFAQNKISQWQFRNTLSLSAICW